MVTGTWLRASTSQRPLAAAYYMSHPSCPHPWGTPSRKTSPRATCGAAGAQNTLTGKAVPEINSGFGLSARATSGLKVKCTGALQVQQPPSLDSRQATPQGPSAAGDVLPPGPPPPPPCPPEAQAPWWSPGIRWNFWALGFQPHGQPRQTGGLRDQVAKPMPPHLYLLVLRFQSDTWICRAQEQKNSPEDPPNSPHRAGPTG